jgi:hypothetical protein
MSNVIESTALFADRTAAMCVSGEWDNAEIKRRMSLFPKSYEPHVVKAVEQKLIELRDENDE